MIPVDTRPRPIPRRDRGSDEETSEETTPYGPYRASFSLTDIVAELASKDLEKKMARCLSEFLFGLNQLEHLPSPRFRKWMMERFATMYRQHLLDTEVAVSEGRLRDAWTHMVCVVAAHARDRIRQINRDLHEAWLEETRERRAAASRRDRAAAVRKRT